MLHESTLAPARILIADDDEGVAGHLTAVLARHGYQIEAAYDGLEALRTLRSRPFDLLLLDVMMPGIDGVEVLEALQREPLERAPVIAMLVPPTALVEDEERLCARLRDRGADDCLVKGQWKQTDVVGLVQRLLSGRGE